jgi:ribonuclease HI
MQKKEGSHAIQVEEKWKPPESGWVKLNCDAVLDERGRCFGLGGILRDEKGFVLAAWSCSRSGLPAPAAAEASALFHGINACKSMGISSLIIESDSLVIVSAVQDIEASSSRYGHLVDDITELLRFFSNWKIVHVRRSSNRAAHVLARAALRNDMDCNWILDVPGCIRDIIVEEQSAPF